MSEETALPMVMQLMMEYVKYVMQIQTIIKMTVQPLEDRTITMVQIAERAIPILMDLSTTTLHGRRMILWTVRYVT
jgi:methionine synthase II (cobalamin-independent)